MKFDRRCIVITRLLLACVRTGLGLVKNITHPRPLELDRSKDKLN